MTWERLAADSGLAALRYPYDEVLDCCLEESQGACLGVRT